MRTLGITQKKLRRNNTWIQITVTTTPSGSSTSTVDAPSTSELTFKEGMTAIGEPIDRWKWKLANGVEASSSLAGERFTAKWQPSLLTGSTVTHFDSPPLNIATTYFKSEYLAQSVPPSGAQLDNSEANNIALQNFVTKARNTQSAFMGGVFIGELRETLALLRPKTWALSRGMTTGYLEAVRNRVTKLNKRRRPAGQGKSPTAASQIATRSRVVADTWLEYSFGVSPLVNDIDSAQRELVKLINKTKPESKGITSGWSASDIALISANSIDIPTLTLHVANRRTFRVDVRYTGAVRVRCQGGASVRESLGLTLSQFVPTLYELVPWSFLVDYFTNLGNIVSAASFPTSDLIYIVKGTKWKNEHLFVPSGSVRPANTVFTTHQGTGYLGFTHFVTEGIDRRDYDGSLIPSLEFGLPGHTRQLFNIAALGLASRRTQRLISTL